MQWVKDYYDAIILFDVIAIPRYGWGTNQRQFSPAFLIETDDPSDSINATTSSIALCLKKQALGLAGRIRALGSIRAGDAPPQEPPQDVLILMRSFKVACETEFTLLPAMAL